MLPEATQPALERGRAVSPQPHSSLPYTEKPTSQLHGNPAWMGAARMDLCYLQRFLLGAATHPKSETPPPFPTVRSCLA